MEQNNVLSLVVGCGGSGITTMTALNRLLAENPQMRTRIHRDIFYIAVDTDAAELQKFKANVQKQMCGAKMPLIKTILLSKDVNILNSIIYPSFVKPFSNTADEETQKGLERLKQNWWFDDDGSPFCAPQVSNLLKGAGQCPPASYCLAWSKLGEIENAIKDIISAIKLRGNSDPTILSTLNLFVIAGLSGGTGRGCWNLITFKIRQCLEAEGVQIPPVGIFFDANVYKNICKAHPQERNSILVNSLTGLSELSCWMNAGQNRGDSKYVFRLPDMRHPAHEDTDVLKTDVDINPKAGAPVNSAYLICGESKSSVLLENTQYHEMAGAGLYAMIMNSQIARQGVNNSNPYNSFAATTFEIDALRLQRYFETIAQGVALDRLKACNDDVNERVDKFLDEVPMAVSVHDKTDLLPNGESGTLIQLASAELLAQCKGALGSLQKNLAEMSPAEAEEEAVSSVKSILASVNEKMITTAVNRAIEKKLNGVSPREKVKEYVDIIFKGERKEGWSVGRVRKFMDALRNKIIAARRGSIEGFTLPNPSGEGKVGPSDWIVSKVSELSKRTFGEKLKGGSPFNPSEIKELISVSGKSFSGSIPESILFASYDQMMKAIETYFKQAMEYIASLVDACDRFTKICDKAKTILEKDAPLAAGGKVDDDPFKLLFASPDDVDSALPPMDSPTLFYHRVLKPIFKDEQAVRDLLLEGDNLHIDNGVNEFVRQAIDPNNGALLQLASVDADVSAESNFTKQLIEVVCGNVGINDMFLEREFTFYRVLERNIDFWNKRIRQLGSNSTRRAELFEKFEKLLGATPEKDPISGYFQLPTVDDLILSISASMARSCSPWWITDVEPQEAQYTVKVFLPEAQSRFKNAYTFAQQLQDSLSFAQVEVAWADDKSAGVTPFSVIAFTANCVPQLTEADINNGKHPLDKIRSLDYYHDAEVSKWLGWAEDPSGRSIFEVRYNNKGIGFVSPIFVKEKKLADARWRPWFHGA